jgi:carotenoid cleavage dioxygenase
MIYCDAYQYAGAYDFQKQFKPKSFSAHPKVDPVTGELMVVAYQVKGDYTKDLAYYAFDCNGVKIDECWFEAPYCGMTHDIGVTENWIIVVITPNAVNSPEKQKAGAQHFEWDENLPLTFGLLPRRNPRPEDVKWCQYKNAYGVHVGNAFDGDDGCIYLDIPVADSNRVRPYDMRCISLICLADVLFQSS